MVQTFLYFGLLAMSRVVPGQCIDSETCERHGMEGKALLQSKFHAKSFVQEEPPNLVKSHRLSEQLQDDDGHTLLQSKVHAVSMLTETTVSSAAAQYAKYYAWGCTAPARDTEVFANIADKSFYELLGSKGQISNNIKHDWCYDDGFATTAPVGSFPEGATDAGVYDMNGNVGEWCEDADPDDATRHVNRGGTWGGAAMYDPGFEGGKDTHFISTWLRAADPGRDDRTGYRVACTCNGGSCASETSVKGIELVKISAAHFSAGHADPVAVGKLDTSADPVSTVTSITSDFWIGKYETTKGQFRSFVSGQPYTPDATDDCYVRVGTIWVATNGRTWDNGISGQNDHHPVSCVTWGDAKAHTSWLTATNGKGWTCTLPTAYQWELAAKGTDTPCPSFNPTNYATIVTGGTCPGPEDDMS